RAGVGELINIVKIILPAILSAGFASCNRVSPDKVVEVAWLNANQVVAFYSPKFFGELRELKSKGNITVFKENKPIKGTAVEYVNQMVVAPFNESMQKVE